MGLWTASLYADDCPASGLTLSLDVYYKKYNNLSIILSPDDYLTGESDALAAAGYAYGAEFLGVYARGRWSASGAYTYSRSLRRAAEQSFPFPYDIPHNGNVYVSFAAVRKKDRTHTLQTHILRCRLRKGAKFF